jgi:hypothetical protein
MMHPLLLECSLKKQGPQKLGSIQIKSRGPILGATARVAHSIRARARYAHVRERERESCVVRLRQGEEDEGEGWRGYLYIVYGF